MSSRLAALRARVGGYAFGGDYNPDQVAGPVTLPPLAVAVVAYRR